MVNSINLKVTTNNELVTCLLTDDITISWQEIETGIAEIKS